MKVKTLVLFCAIVASQAASGQGLSIDKTVQNKIKTLAQDNGFFASDRIADAIADAALTYQVDALQLTAIGIIETGLGKYLKTRQNSNGTQDQGLFQINTVNLPRCKAFRIETIEGSAFCAAKILSQIKIRKPIDVAAYHSKTPSKKSIYFQKMTQVLRNVADKR